MATQVVDAAIAPAFILQGRMEIHDKPRMRHAIVPRLEAGRQLQRSLLCGLPLFSVWQYWWLVWSQCAATVRLIMQGVVVA